MQSGYSQAVASSSDSAAPIADTALPPQVNELPQQQTFRISPLIRITLLGLYLALMLPLPFLAQATAAPVSPAILTGGISLGGITLYAALTERVIVDEHSIQVTYPRWVPRFFRKGWSLPWTDIQALKPRSTGQNGLVYYFLSQSGEGYLLPMRVAGFSQLLRHVQAKTDIDMTDVKPLSQPWMYLLLLLLTLLLLAIDAWTIWTALTLSSPA